MPDDRTNRQSETQRFCKTVMSAGSFEKHATPVPAQPVAPGPSSAITPPNTHTDFAQPDVAHCAQAALSVYTPHARGQSQPSDPAQLGLDASATDHDLCRYESDHAHSLSATPMAAALRPGLSSKDGPPGAKNHQRDAATTPIVLRPATTGLPPHPVYATAPNSRIQQQLRLRSSEAKTKLECFSETARTWPCRCGLAFRRKHDLGQHIKALHQLKRPFCCEKCNAAFAQKGTVSRHMKTVHEKRKDSKCGHSQLSPPVLRKRES